MEDNTKLNKILIVIFVLGLLLMIASIVWNIWDGGNPFHIPQKLFYTGSVLFAISVLIFSITE